jgi:hypothetical protein
MNDDLMIVEVGRTWGFSVCILFEDLHVASHASIRHQ